MYYPHQKKLIIKLYHTLMWILFVNNIYIYMLTLYLNEKKHSVKHFYIKKKSSERLIKFKTLNYKKWHYNFQRWMSRFSQRWRTQRNAIRNANCRIQWIIKFLNANCASGYSWKHACFSVCRHNSQEWFHKIIFGGFWFLFVVRWAWIEV